MRILFLSHYFPPEIGAPAARVSELATAWAATHEVTVVTGFPNHPTGKIPESYRGEFFREEKRDGYRVLRAWLYATPNEGVLKRTLSHLSFMVTGFLTAACRLSRPDIILATSPTFFSVFAAWALSLRFQTPFVFEVRDLWPGIFVELGILKNRTLIRLLEAAELWLYRRAALVVTVTHGFAENISRRGISPGKLLVIPNGADLDRFVPGSPSQELRAVMGARPSDFLVLYLGAHGISHALEKVLDAADRLRNHPTIRFAFVGEGAQKSLLVQIAAERRLPNVIFLPGQPRESVPNYYCSADLCLVPLRDVPLFSTFIPSKIFEAMACGRPILGALRGEAAEILVESGGALVVEPEAPQQIADAIMALTVSPERLASMGQNARRYVEEHFSRRELAARYLQRLEDLVQ